VSSSGCPHPTVADFAAGPSLSVHSAADYIHRSRVWRAGRRARRLRMVGAPGASDSISAVGPARWNSTTIPPPTRAGVSNTGSRRST
jgi:hypothetical protein